jgi:hypothetical protein
VLLLVALFVTLGAAQLLENMATNQRPDRPDDQPFIPGAVTPAQQPAPAPVKPLPPEQSRSLSLVIRRT